MRACSLDGSEEISAEIAVGLSWWGAREEAWAFVHAKEFSKVSVGQPRLMHLQT